MTEKKKLPLQAVLDEIEQEIEELRRERQERKPKAREDERPPWAPPLLLK